LRGKEIYGMVQQSTQEESIYHITTPELWATAGADGLYEAASLEKEGFIHCSIWRQLERSMNKFFADQKEVILLRIDPKLLTHELKYEPADGDQFPHVYGPINVDAVTGVVLVERGEDGRFRAPEERG
jgi:uncharacterized protein (DUF952 family)